MDRKFRSKSIAFKLTIAFVVSLVLQSVLLVSFMVVGGVMEQAEANQYRIFAEKVKGRRNNLENQMKNVWTNFSHHTDTISRYFDSPDGLEYQGQPDRMLEALAPEVLDALYDTKTTGVFLILPDEGRQTAPWPPCTSGIIIRTATAARMKICICSSARGT